MRLVEKQPASVAASTTSSRVFIRTSAPAFLSRCALPAGATHGMRGGPECLRNETAERGEGMPSVETCQRTGS